MKIETLPKDKVAFWLDKTNKSIASCARIQHDLSKNHRLSELVLRYNDLKDKAKSFEIWDSYCKERGFDVNHDGFDSAA